MCTQDAPPSSTTAMQLLAQRSVDRPRHSLVDSQAWRSDSDASTLAAAPAAPPLLQFIHNVKLVQDVLDSVVPQLSPLPVEVRRRRPLAVPTAASVDLPKCCSINCNCMRAAVSIDSRAAQRRFSARALQQ
jgi:hypothetical protein